MYKLLAEFDQAWARSAPCCLLGDTNIQTETRGWSSIYKNLFFPFLFTPYWKNSKEFYSWQVNLIRILMPEITTLFMN